MRNLVLLIFACLLTVNAAAAAEGLPAAGSNYTAHWTTFGYEVVLPLFGVSGYSAITVTSSDPNLHANIHSEPLTDSKNGPIRALDIKIERKNLGPAQYPVLLTAQLLQPSDPKVKADERGLLIQIPAVTVETPASLIVWRTVWHPFHDPALRASHPEIEMSGTPGWLTSVVLRQKGDVEPNDGETGEITFKAIGTIAPKAVKRLSRDRKDFAVTGDFPLGVARGNIVLTADQLATPVTFPFEVRSALPKLYIPFVLVVGLLLGFLTRTFLKNRIDIFQKRQAVLVLLRALDAEGDTSKDPKFLGTVAALRTDLTRLLQSFDANAIQSGIDQAKTNLAAAHADLDQRTTDILQKRDALEKLTAPDWRAPRAVLEQLKQADRSLRDVMPGADIRAAADKIEQWTDSTSSVIAKSEAALCKAVRGLSDENADYAKLAGTDAAGAFKQALDSAYNGMNAALTEQRKNPQSSLDLMLKSLSAMHSGANGLEDALTNASAALTQGAAGLDRRIASKQHDEQAWDDAMQQAKQLADDLTSAAPDAQDLSGDMAGRATAVLDAMKAAMAAQAGDNAPLKSALDQDNIADAIAALPDTLPEKMVEIRGFVAGKAAGVGEGALELFGGDGDTDGVSGTRRLWKVPSLPDLSASASALTPRTLDAFSKVTKRELAIAEGVRTTIFGTIIVLSGYMLFQAKWVGVSADFLEIFAWAYALDIGADAAATALQAAARR